MRLSRLVPNRCDLDLHHVPKLLHLGRVGPVVHYQSPRQPWAKPNAWEGGWRRLGRIRQHVDAVAAPGHELLEQGLGEVGLADAIHGCDGVGARNSRSNPSVPAPARSGSPPRCPPIRPAPASVDAQSGHGQLLEAAQLVGQGTHGGAEQDVLPGPDHGRCPAGNGVFLIKRLAGALPQRRFRAGA